MKKERWVIRVAEEDGSIRATPEFMLNTNDKCVLWSPWLSHHRLNP